MSESGKKRRKIIVCILFVFPHLDHHYNTVFFFFYFGPMTTSSELVFCVLCDKLTSEWHERRHRKSVPAPVPPIAAANTSSHFIVVASDSESSSDDDSETSARSLARNTHDYDVPDNPHVHFDEIPFHFVDEVDNNLHQASRPFIGPIFDPYQWLHDNYPTAEIWDSEEEDRETWLKRTAPPPGVSIEAHERQLQEERRLRDQDRTAGLDNEEEEVTNLSQRIKSWHALWESSSESDGADGSDAESESDVEEEDVGIDWDAFERAAAGVSAFDRLGEKFQAEVFDGVDRLSELDKAICHAYAWKVQSHTADEYYQHAPQAFGPRQGEPLPKLHTQRRRLLFLAGFKPQEYHCCINSCVCYAGTYADHQQCPYCKEPRFKPSGKPRKFFTYIPLIPRLRALFQNHDLAKKMRYRHDRLAKDVIEDIFDGEQYKELRNTSVHVGDTHYDRNYFSDPREVALGLSTDGFCPFKKRNKTAWPIILIPCRTLPSRTHSFPWCHPGTQETP
ncbi:hypothetical protein D9758_018932 [Tetrapyrgos nigripes]|uniref:Uncharacterized protein n=1 Tax=Tetrapyrgos nigripes TaxID=182062 RepID=A0A8H5ARL5_9AGAR|nr:hypothetical protein D9758_018932 [Tetrapyrgos nigripes]